MQTLLRVAKDETKSKAAREQAIKNINKISPAYLGNINLENINSQKVAKAIDKYTEAIERKARAQAFSGLLAEEEAKILEEQLKSAEEFTEQGGSMMNTFLNQIGEIKHSVSNAVKP